MTVERAAPDGVPDGVPDEGSGGVRDARAVLAVGDDPRVLGPVVLALRTAGYAVTRLAPVPALVLAVPADLLVLDLSGAPDPHGLLAPLVTPDGPPVVVLTRPGDATLRAAALRAGAADGLAVPFLADELVARVRARLPAAPPLGELVAGDLVLRTADREVVVAGRAGRLSRRETALLAHLMRRAGTVCTRAELLAEVWGIGFDPGSNVVDVYVRRLRARLEPPDGSDRTGGHRRIETVRDQGYRFRPRPAPVPASADGAP